MENTNADAAMAAADGADLSTGNMGAGQVQDPWGNMNKQTPEVAKELAEQAKQARDMLPFADVIKDFLTAEREDIQKYHSYATAIFARNGGKAAKQEDIAAEFRAREMYLAMLDRLEDKISGQTLTLENKIKEEEAAKDIAKRDNQEQ